MKLSPRSVLAIVAVAVLGLSASSTAVARPAKTPFYGIASQGLVEKPGTLLRHEKISLPPFYRAKAWRILYTTRDYAGRPTASSGVVLLSSYAPANPNERKIVAWAHGTTGIARKCAPSMRGKPTEWIVGLNELVAAGYIVTATDYPGLGTDGPIAYLVGKAQAHAVIDSVRAARQLEGVGGGANYALWGYSQGGHAAIFAAQESVRYAPELKLVGVAATAPPTDLRKLLAVNINSIEGRILAAMTLGSWSKSFGVPFGALIDDKVAKVVAKVGRDCVDDLGGQLDVLAAQKPLRDKFLNHDPGTYPPWDGYLSGNSLFGLGAKVPIIIAQGDADALVRPEITNEYVRALCRQKLNVRYVSLKGKGHGLSAKASVASVIPWIRDRFRGARAPSSCR